MRGAKPQLVIDNDAMEIVPAPPSWFSSDAKAEWRRVIPLLIKRRILTGADLGSLENYCLAQARVRDAERVLKKATDPEAWTKIVRMQDKAMATARQLAAELGLTPVSRSRPAIRSDEDDGDDDPLDIS